MPENWKKYKFSELFETASGLSKSRDQFGFGSPFLTFKDVFYNYFIPPELGDLANTTEKEQIRGSVKRGDIFLTRTSETLHELGMSSIALKDYPNATFNGFCKRLRPKKGSTVKIHPEFIGYFLRSKSFRNEVSQHATMTTRASLNNTSINSLSVSLPSFAEQVEIGEILKSLDDKMELNLKMNKTLEEMAMALYKHWFVDFGPFQDGEFVDSELGEIPKGWEVKTLGEVSDVGSSKRIFYNEYVDSGIPFFRGKEIIQLSQGKSISTELFIETDKYNLIKEKFGVPQKDDILISSVGTIGVSWLVENNKPFYFKDGNLTWIKNYKPEVNGHFISQWLKSPSTQDQIKGETIGSTQQALTISALRTLKIALPKDESYVEDISVKLKLWNTALVSNRKEIELLTQLRDTLLPKLISGEVRVKDVEKTLSEVL